MKECKVSIKTIVREGCKDFARTKRETFSKENCLITDKDKFIYLLILRFRDENKNGESTISRKSIAEFMSSTNKVITVDNVSESISSLRRAKYIEVKEKLFWSEKNQCSATSHIYVPLIDVDKKIENWDKIPSSLLFAKSITWQDRLFSIQMYPFIHEATDEIRLPNRELAIKLNISQQTLKTKISTFVESGVLIKIKDDFGYKVDVKKLLFIGESEFIKIIQNYESRLEEERNKNKRLTSILKENKIAIEDDFEEIDGVMSATIKRPTYKNK